MDKVTKETLDKLMKEYDWDKNTLLDSACFLAYMCGNYSQLYRKQLMEEENA